MGVGKIEKFGWKLQLTYKFIIPLYNCWHNIYYYFLYLWANYSHYKLIIQLIQIFSYLACDLTILYSEGFFFIFFVTFVLLLSILCLGCIFFSAFFVLTNNNNIREKLFACFSELSAFVSLFWSIMFLFTN